MYGIRCRVTSPRDNRDHKEIVTHGKPSPVCICWLDYRVGIDKLRPALRTHGSLIQETAYGLSLGTNVSWNLVQQRLSHHTPIAVVLTSGEFMAAGLVRLISD